MFFLDANLKEKKLGYSTKSYSLFNDENSNVLWLASSTGLEIKRNGIYQKILVDNKPVFSSKIIAINNQIWITSTIGLLICENEKLVRKIETNQGLLSNTVIKIIRDKEYVYISTNEGL